MTHVVDAGLLVQAAASLLYIVLGIWVLTLTPRRRQTTLLGAFALFIGLIAVPGAILVALDIVGPTSLTTQILSALFWNLAWLAALGLAVSAPDELEDRRLLGVALVAGVVVAADGAAFTLVVEPPLSVHPLVHAVSHVGVAAEAAALALLGLRARPSREPTREEVTQLAILTVAIFMLNGFVDGQDLVARAAPLTVADPFAGAFTILVELDEVVIAAGIWGWNMLQAGDETVRLHRAALLGILAPITAGTLYQTAFPGFVPDFTSLSTASVDASTIVVHGVVRTLGVGLLAYGVLRHDLAGLDEKVEFGVSRTTVAGVFVAVFFVVSEGAQVLLAGYAGSEILGVLAAGALVFFLAPIQRAADDLAEAVVPGGEPAAGGDREARFREVYRMALSDGEITRDEERRLAAKAEELGLSPTRVQELREQVETEAEGGDEP